MPSATLTTEQIARLAAKQQLASARTLRAWLRKIKKTGAAPMVQAAITKAEQETDGYYASVKEHFPEISGSATMLCDVLNYSD